MKYAFTLLLFPLLMSCKKEKSDTHLMMRLKNITGQSFTYSSAASKEFVIIPTGAATAYKSFESIAAYPGATVTIDGETKYAGLLYCGTPPMPMLEDGKYTLEIFEDNTVAQGFLSARFIKD
jgi:hypothetical protein